MKTLLLPLLLFFVLLVAPAYSQTVVPVMAENVNSPGDYSCPLIHIPIGATNITVEFLKAHRVAKFGAFYGQVWMNRLGATSDWELAGGFFFAGNTNVDSLIVAPIVLSEPSNIARLVRCTFTVYGEKWNGGAVLHIE